MQGMIAYCIFWKQSFVLIFDTVFLKPGCEILNVCLFNKQSMKIVIGVC